MANKESITIYLIRHGEAKASWDEDKDPGLSQKGKEQSRCLVKEILCELPTDIKVISSPLLRAKETAFPLQNKMGFDLEINKVFSEIPSPGIPLSERRNWLRDIFNIKVKDLKKPQQKWRDKINESLKLIQKDTLIFSHFMVINSVVGWINKSEKFVNFYPDNCSITEIKKHEEKFKITELGRDLPTIIQ